MNLLILILLSFGHMIADIHQGVVPTLMLYLRDVFDLGYAQVGTIVLVSNLSSSVVQPMFGFYSDRSSLPWLMPVGIGLSAVGISLAGITPHYFWVMVAVFVSGLGVAAYHPEGTKMAYLVAGDRKNSAMSVFSVGGNLGYGLGPVLGALFFGAWGLSGSLAFLVPGIATTVAFHVLQPKISAATRKGREAWLGEKESARINNNITPPWSRGPIVLVMIVVFRSWVQYGLTSYLPFYYTDYLGGDKHIAAALVSVFLISGAVGTLIGGPLADRFGTKRHICISLGLMFPLLYILLNTSGAATVILTSLTGMVLISTFSPTLVMGQQYLPHHIGLASGLLTGFAVGIGGLGVPILGAFADKFGLDLVLKIIAFLPLAGLLLSLFLPKPPEEAEEKISPSNLRLRRSK